MYINIPATGEKFVSLHYQQRFEVLKEAEGFVHGAPFKVSHSVLLSVSPVCSSFIAVIIYLTANAKRNLLS